MVVANGAPAKGQQGTLVTIQGLFAPDAGGGTKTVKVILGGQEASKIVSQTASKIIVVAGECALRGG